MIATIRSPDGRVTVIDDKTGSISAATEAEAVRKIDEIAFGRPAVETYSPFNDQNNDAHWWGNRFP